MSQVENRLNRQSSWPAGKGSSESAPAAREGGLARPIEKITSKIPSDTFLWLAGGSIAASLTLKLMGREKDAMFVGQWVAPIMLLGVYNKIVKVAGHDRES